MPLYFFHTYENGQDVFDEVGTWLEDDQEARAQAISTSGEMLREIGGQFWRSGAWRMRVVSEGGKDICVLRFVSDRHDREVAR